MGGMRLHVSGCVTLHECPYHSTLPSWPWVASNHLEGMFWVQLLLILLFASDNSIIVLRKKEIIIYLMFRSHQKDEGSSNVSGLVLTSSSTYDTLWLIFGLII